MAPSSPDLDSLQIGVTTPGGFCRGDCQRESGSLV